MFTLEHGQEKAFLISSLLPFEHFIRVLYESTFTRVYNVSAQSKSFYE